MDRHPQGGDFAAVPRLAPNLLSLSSMSWDEQQSETREVETAAARVPSASLQPADRSPPAVNVNLNVIVVFTPAPTLQTLVPRMLAVGLLLVWAFGVLTANRMGGFVNGFLIAGAVMVMISLFLGRKSITHAAHS